MKYIKVCCLCGAFVNYFGKWEKMSWYKLYAKLYIKYISVEYCKSTRIDYDFCDECRERSLI